MRTLLSILILLFPLGCGQSLQSGSAEPVRLQVQPSSIAAGGSVTLLLVNGSGGEVGYNLCSSALERLELGEWVGVESDRVCTMELRTLPPGEEATYPFEIPAGLTPGDYRFVTNVHGMEEGGGGPIRSEPFRISN